MWDWLKKRFSEPSSWGGVAAVVYGAGVLGKIDEAPQIAEAVGSAGQVIATGDYATGLGMMAAGILGAFMKEKGS